MKGMATFAMVLALAGGAAAQAPKPPPAAKPAPSPAALVQEFKGLAEARTRSPEQLRADLAAAAKHLLGQMADRKVSSRRRLVARDDLEAVCVRAARPGAEAERAAMCAALLGCLAADEKGGPRATALRMLGYIGRDESVEPLAGLLGGADEDLRERARRVLEANPSPRASEKLRQALYQAVNPTWRVGLVNSLGRRRDAGSVEYLAKLLKDKDASVAAAAAAALGKIGGPEVIKALNDVRLLALGPLRDEIADALFSCAEKAMAAGDRETAITIYRKAFENPLEPRRNRVAALRCLVAAQGEEATPMVVGLLGAGDESILPVAMALAREIPGRQATRAFAAMLERARDADKKVALIELLGSRGDPVARDAVLGAIRGRKWGREEREAVRIAVIKALAGVGNETDVEMLVRLATQDVKGKEAERKWAKWSLERLRGPKVDAALLNALSAGEPAVRREVIGALAAREVTEAVPELLGMAGESDTLLRYAALQALGQLGGKSALGPLVKWLGDAKESSEVYMAERAIVEVCGRYDDPDAAAEAVAASMRGASVRGRGALMRICGRVGGAKAIEMLAAGVADEDATVRAAAVKALSYSRDTRAADTLLKIAASASKPEIRTEALQGYIRLMRYLEQAPEKKLWMYIRVLDLAIRPAEKKLALAGLGDVKSLAAMKMAMEHLDFPDVRPEAEMAAYRVARHIYTTHPKEVIQAMQRLLGLTENENTAKEAKRILQLAQQAAKAAGGSK